MTHEQQTDRLGHHSWGEHKTLLQSVDFAEDIKVITGTEARVLRLLCKNIEFGLDAPYSILPVIDAAFELECSTETVRRSIASLHRKELIEKKMPANGHRGRFRNKVNGINLSPLLECHEDLRTRRANKRQDMNTFRSIKSEISSLRGQIATALRDGCELSAAAARCWAKLPRRITFVCIAKLGKLLKICQRILSRMGPHPTDLSDATHKDTGQFTDTHHDPFICKYDAEKLAEPDVSGDTKTQTYLAAMKVLDQAIASDQELSEHAKPFMKYNNPVVAAVELCSEMAWSVGVPHRSVLAAKDRLDTGDFLGLCLLVWAKCSQRGRVPAYDQIMKPANWFGAMNSKSQLGKARIHQSLMGLQKHFAYGT